MSLIFLRIEHRHRILTLNFLMGGCLMVRVWFCLAEGDPLGHPLSSQLAVSGVWTYGHLRH
jgi:hypothetical protein